MTTHPDRMTVDHGIIVVNTIHLLIESDVALVWEVDLASKRAVIMSMSNDEIMLGCDDDTRGFRDDMPQNMPTVLRVHVPESWCATLLAECTKYTVRVVAYRRVEPVATRALRLC